jgi:hypothetical protein
MVTAEAQRTLVKSPPELWSELSDPAALARHLGELGEIRIVRTHAEHSVEWETQEHTRGKVEIKPSGWGTKVLLSVTIDSPLVEPSEGAAGATAVATAVVTEAEPPTQTSAATEPTHPVRGEGEAGPPNLAAAADPAPGATAAGVESEPHRPLVALLRRLRLGRLARRRARRPARAEAPAGGALPTRAAMTAPAPEVRDSPPRAVVAVATPTLALAAQPTTAQLAMAQPAITSRPANAPQPAIAAQRANTQEAGSRPQRDAMSVGGATSIDRHAERQVAEQTTALLSAVLDSLGEAHHRPFSRT